MPVLQLRFDQISLFILITLGISKIICILLIRSLYSLISQIP